MLAMADKEDRAEILRYLGEEKGKCLYMYMDILKFGLGHPEIDVWVQRNGCDILAVMMRYHNGLHIYARDAGCLSNEIVDLIKRERPTMICGEKYIVQGIADELPGYMAEYGVVSRLSVPVVKCTGCDVGMAQSADFPQVAQMLKEDDDYGAAFTSDELELQFRGRQESGLSRSYVLRCGGKVVAHVATGAECDAVATISGVVVRTDYRRQGLATKVMRALCADLQSEGKDVYSIYYVDQSARLHGKLGFVKYCDWGKLFTRV